MKRKGCSYIKTGCILLTGILTGMVSSVGIFPDQSQALLQIHAAEASTVETESKTAVPAPSKAELVYELETPFVGDGSGAYVDTGIKLYDGSMENWIVIACISNELGSGDNVFLSCFSENQPYRGFLLRNPTTQSYEFICGDSGQTWSYTEDATYFTIAIQKKGDNYSIMHDGAVLYELESGEIDSYAGNLLIGCQEDANGNRFRFGSVSVAGLEVYEGTQSPSLTASRMEELLTRASEMEAKVQNRVLVDREENSGDRTLFQTLLVTLQENGRVLLLLLAGFAVSCIIVYMLDRNRHNREDK